MSPRGRTGLERRSPDRHAQRSALRTSQPHVALRANRPGTPVSRPARAALRAAHVVTPPGTGGSHLGVYLQGGDGAHGLERRSPDRHRGPQARGRRDAVRLHGTPYGDIRFVQVNEEERTTQRVEAAPCAARSAAVPVWRPAFQGVRVVRGDGRYVVRGAGRRAAHVATPPGKGGSHLGVELKSGDGAHGLERRSPDRHSGPQARGRRDAVRLQGTPYGNIRFVQVNAEERTTQRVEVARWGLRAAHTRWRPERSPRALAGTISRHTGTPVEGASHA